MSARTIVVAHGGRDYSGEIMRIKSTYLGVEDHGILSFMLHCEAQGSGIGVGGYGMDTPVRDADDRFSHREGTAYGTDLILRVLKTAGVPKWEALVGKHVVVLYAGRAGLGGMSVGFAGIDNDEVLILEEHSAEWKARGEGGAA